MAGFRGHLVVEPLKDGKRWVLHQPYAWENGRGYQVPALFVTDFASVPSWLPGVLAAVLGALLAAPLGSLLACLVAAAVALWLGLSPNGRHQNGAVIHDGAYWFQDVPRAEADQMFLDCMRDGGVWLTRRWAYWATVRIFGRWAWWANKRLRAAGETRVLERLPDEWSVLPARGIERWILIALGRAKEA